MRFNPANPCCAALPAWTVYHDEVPKEIHVIQVGSSASAYNRQEQTSKVTPYLGYLFFNATSGDDSEYWVYKNCPGVEGGINVTMILEPTEMSATGRCAEQTWIKAAKIHSFEYNDSGSDISQISSYKLKFRSGQWVNTCCHLWGITGDNYLGLNGNLGPDSGWNIKGATSDDSDLYPNLWTTVALVPRAGTTAYDLRECSTPDGFPTSGYFDTPIGDFSFGVAITGSYWMVGTLSPQSPGGFTNYTYDTTDPNGFYWPRWSLSTFGLACGYYGATGTCITPCESCIQGWDSAYASIQTNPLYLDSACGYAYYNNGQIYYDYWPWQYWWGFNSGFEDPGYFNWGSWNYGWWWAGCDFGNPGLYAADQFGWWWGGPFYAGGFSNTWNWWGTYPCYTYIYQPYCWWWGWGLDGWWSWMNWWWWGGPNGYLGDWVNNATEEAFDGWYALVEQSTGFGNGTCSTYSRCQENSVPIPLDCRAFGVRPFNCTVSVKVGDTIGNITLSGDVTIDAVAQPGTSTTFGTCGFGVEIYGSLQVSGLLTGTVDVRFSNPSGTWLFPFDSNAILTLFGSGVSSSGQIVPLNYVYRGDSRINAFLGGFYTGWWGELLSGSIRMVVRFPVPGNTYLDLNSGLDLSGINSIEFSSNLFGTVDVRYTDLQYKKLNCNNSIQCIPRKPVLGQANMIHHDVEYTFVYNEDCFLIDVIPDIDEYCYALAYYEPTTERHALGELYGFTNIPNPPLSSYEELPWGIACSASVQLVQLVVLTSDMCLPENL